jgi:hypothetical protein
MRTRSLLALAVLASALVAPAASHADPVVTNPFGNLQLAITKAPSGATPGTARLTIVTANGAAFSQGSRIYFGLRFMGNEDMQMTKIEGPLPATGCIVSDFAGNNTAGKWEGAPVFGAGADPAGTPNSHMRMVGGVIQKSCGNIVVDVSFQASPLVVFYGAFFGYDSAPWNSSKTHGYTDAPFNTIPTTGDHTYDKWWDLWGTFTTLGYSNACLYTSGSPAC